MSRTFTIFGEKSILDIRRRRESDLLEDIRTADFDEILSTNKEDFISNLISKYSFETFELDFDNQDGIKRTKNGKKILTIRIPFEGKEEQLKWRPQSRTVADYTCYVKDDCLCFDIDPETNNLADKIDQKLDSISNNSHSLYSDIKESNERLQNLGAIEREYNSRCEEAEEHQDELDDLDFPIREEE
ncbi:hypothetical protein [Haladaptatus sp. CMAA 1911]|uniref:hypothetical protein n=1 Tax=unclassified Haladaptatus TaxID=2622732 RepID=UPI0037550C71